MFKTPDIPSWIKRIDHPLYRNIYSYKLRNKNLWGTETLLGDWDGEYLLLAKDFYPAIYIDEAIARGTRYPYHHNPKAPTNRNLLKTLVHFGCIASKTTAIDCNFLYASACFLLRNDGVIRGSLPDATGVLLLSAPVVNFTIDNMPNLRSVVAMGKDAAEAVTFGGLDQTIRARKLTYYRVSHPSYAMSDDQRFSEWGPVFARKQNQR